TANPPDLRPAYAQARMAVMPLLDGGGTRIKVLEALTVGCPIVATAKAVEGLGLLPDVHYLEANASDEFIAAIQRIYSDSALARRLVAQGKKFAEDHFSEPVR